MALPKPGGRCGQGESRPCAGRRRQCAKCRARRCLLLRGRVAGGRGKAHDRGAGGIAYGLASRSPKRVVVLGPQWRAVARRRFARRAGGARRCAGRGAGHAARTLDRRLGPRADAAVQPRDGGAGRIGHVSRARRRARPAGGDDAARRRNGLPPVDRARRLSAKTRSRRRARAASRWNACVAFKGGSTVIASPDGACGSSMMGRRDWRRRAPGTRLAGLIGGLAAPGPAAAPRLRLGRGGTRKRWGLRCRGGTVRWAIWRASWLQSCRPACTRSAVPCRTEAERASQRFPARARSLQARHLRVAIAFRGGAAACGEQAHRLRDLRLLDDPCLRGAETQN